jgi:hypothetical protein
VTRPAADEPTPRNPSCAPPGAAASGSGTIATMDAEAAQSIAVLAHAPERDPDGGAVLAHVERVVRATPAEAHVIAWLHEVLERGAVTEHELLAGGLSPDELRALRLVTSPTWSRSDRVWLGHVELIARAAGWPGRAARTVKRADLCDGVMHPRSSPDGWSPPYVEGLQRLRSSREELAPAVTSATVTGAVALDASGASAVGTA